MVSGADIAVVERGEDVEVGDNTVEGLQKGIGSIRDCFGEIDPSDIKKLNRLLPICAWCKKILDDQGYWKKAEVHTYEHSGQKFIHGICPDCVGKLIEEMG